MPLNKSKGWEGTYAYRWLIHVDIWQKTTKFCKLIILQFKKTLKNKTHTQKPKGLAKLHIRGPPLLESLSRAAPRTWLVFSRSVVSDSATPSSHMVSSSKKDPQTAMSFLPRAGHSAQKTSGV